MLLYQILNKDSVVATVKYMPENKMFTLLECLGNFIVELTDRNITAWVFDRRAPISRMFMDTIYSKLDIQDIRNYIKACSAVSLNDTFWIKPVNSKLTWEQVSPYTRPFNNTVASSMMGYGNLCKTMLNSLVSSPELSTEGKFAKCWQRRNGNIYLLKRGKCGLFGTDGRETFSEYFSFQIAKALGIRNIADYDLGTFKGDTVVFSKAFTTEQFGFLPLSIVLGDKSPEDELNFMRSIGSELQFRELMLLDSITLNYDRHLNNIGVLIYNNSLDVRRLAPIFDNNLALFPSIVLKNRTKADVWAQIRNNNVPKRNFSNFIEQAIYYLTPELAKRLETLTRFNLNQHHTIKVDIEYFKLVDGFTRYMARTILDVYYGRIVLDPFNSVYSSPYGLI